MKGFMTRHHRTVAQVNMMVRKGCLTVTIISLLNVIMCSLAPWGRAEERVYPHWTGKHCTECHLEEKIPELRFDGDVVRVCNRCHQAAAPCTTVHVSTFISPEDASAVTIPADWPRHDSTVTCLTCHAVTLQMYADAAGEQVSNPTFLRAGEQGSGLYRFCFNCHREHLFQKINPHQGTSGAEGQLFCFRCHTGKLSTGFETCFEASLKTKSNALCTGCHWQVTTNGHTVHDTLAPDKLKASKDALGKLEQDGLELPLADGSMHCATCHNPHPKGIIGRKDAAIGAGEKYFLRIPDKLVLCGACHSDKTVDEYIKLFKDN